jgi:gamma-glutamyltranspeptidase
MYLGDPAFVEAPIARLTDDAYITSRAAEAIRQANPRRKQTVNGEKRP